MTRWKIKWIFPYWCIVEYINGTHAGLYIQPDWDTAARNAVRLSRRAHEVKRCVTVVVQGDGDGRKEGSELRGVSAGEIGQGLRDHQATCGLVEDSPLGGGGYADTGCSG